MMDGAVATAGPLQDWTSASTKERQHPGISRGVRWIARCAGAGHRLCPLQGCAGVGHSLCQIRAALVRGTMYAERHPPPPGSYGLGVQDSSTGAMLCGAVAVGE